MLPQKLVRKKILNFKRGSRLSTPEDHSVVLFVKDAKLQASIFQPNFIRVQDKKTKKTKKGTEEKK